MTPHHDDRERHGSHPLREYVEPPERSRADDMMERMETDRTVAGPSAIPFTWSGMKELGYVVSVVAGLAGVYYGIRGDIQEGRRDVQELAGRVLVIERGRAENIPRLEEQIRNNALQDQRIQNLTEAGGRTITAVNDLTRVIGGLGDRIGDLRERQAVLEERVGHAGPHDR